MMNDEVVKTQETAATEVVAEVNPAPAEKRAGGFNREGREGGRDGHDRRPGGKRPFNKNKRHDEDDGLIKKTVSINRVTKVVKGGRTMRFSALVVVGDGKGKVGVGMGKAGEVPQAIEKATQQAKRSMSEISLLGSTIPHEIIGKFGKGHVLLLREKRARSLRSQGHPHKELRQQQPHQLCQGYLRGTQKPAHRSADSGSPRQGS